MQRNSTLLRFHLDDVAIGFATDQSIQFSKNLPETTNKDSGNFKSSMSGTKSGSGSSSGFYAENLTALFAWFNGSDTATMTLTNGTSGDEYYEGEAHCNELSINSSGDNQPVTYSISFEFTGEYTATVNP